MASVTLPGIGEGDTQRTEVSVRQIAQKVQLLATLDSPVFTGDPQAPTQPAGDNSTNLATTAYVDNATPWKLLRKAVDHSVSNTTAFADDDDLKFAVVADGVYRFRMTLFFNNAAQGKFAVNGPSGFSRLRVGNVSGSASTTAFDTTINAPLTGVSQWSVEGLFVNGSTPGTLALRIAQQASSASLTTLEKGSTLEYTKTDPAVWLDDLGLPILDDAGRPILL